MLLHYICSYSKMTKTFKKAVSWAKHPKRAPIELWHRYGPHMKNNCNPQQGYVLWAVSSSVGRAFIYKPESERFDSQSHQAPR